MYSNLTRILNSRQVILVAILTSVMTFSGCLQSNASEGFLAGFNQTRSTPSDISENTIELVNDVFNKSFLGGDWRYKGASEKNGAINVYIQIPQDLDMSVDAQKNYLKQAICPSAQHQEMWSEIQSIPLYVHVYTHTQKRTVFSGCTNPIV
ncbi:MAG: hypothetical protein ACI808_000354 [Paraglaciecola sp.]|jgi:hypothetical protein